MLKKYWGIKTQNYPSYSPEKKTLGRRNFSKQVSRTASLERECIKWNRKKWDNQRPHKDWLLGKGDGTCMKHGLRENSLLKNKLLFCL